MSKIYCVETRSYFDDDDDRKYTLTWETQKIGTVRCAVMRLPNDTKTYLRPWDTFAFLHRPGEKNIHAKLKTAQVRAMVVEAYTKPRTMETLASLAKKYDVTPGHVADIVQGRAWRHVTMGLIAQLKNGNKEVLNSCISVSNAMRRKNTKINSAIAKFIVRDSYLNKIPEDVLAKKYCLSRSSIHRIVTGRAWCAVTIPAIKEYGRWK